MDDAHVRVGILFEHGMNRLTEFGCIGLVDTACIGPDKFVSQRLGCLTESYEFGETCSLEVGLFAEAELPRRDRGGDVLIVWLAVGPAVRKGGVSHNVADDFSEDCLSWVHVDACFGVCGHPVGVHSSLNILFRDLGDV